MRRSVFLAGILTTLSALAVAQERQTFRAATRLVEVPVVVTDPAGRPIRGLREADFILTEDGIPQTVSLLHVKDPARFTVGPVPSTDTPADVFTNRTTTTGAGARVVMLLDRLNASFASQWHARRHLDRVLRRLQPDDLVALYVLDTGVRPLHDFTNDASSLRRALERYEAHVRGEYVASNEPLDATPADGSMAVWIVDPAFSSADFFTTRRGVGTFQSLQALASHLSGIPGRKSVVWISEAFPTPGAVDVRQEMRRAVRELNDAQVALYAVDARGLVGALTSERGRISFTTFAMVRGNIETMEFVTEGTGGRTFANTNALDASMQRAIDDGRISYVLGYYTPAAQQDGRYRRISVRVKKKDVVVRHRQGYIDLPADGDRTSREAALHEALRAPLVATGVTLSARTSFEPATSRVAIDVEVDPESLLLETRTGRRVVTVDLVAAQVSRDGTGVLGPREVLDVALPSGPAHAGTTQRLTARLELLVSPATDHIRIVARDAASGRVGSLNIPVAKLKR